MTDVQNRRRERNVAEGKRSGYCIDNYCALFNVDTGEYDSLCGGCSEFDYYFWLLDNGHILNVQFPKRQNPKVPPLQK